MNVLLLIDVKYFDALIISDVVCSPDNTPILIFPKDNSFQGKNESQRGNG
jgi:hypothetical protein